MNSRAASVSLIVFPVSGWGTFPNSIMAMLVCWITNWANRPEKNSSWLRSSESAAAEEVSLMSVTFALSSYFGQQKIDQPSQAFLNVQRFQNGLALRSPRQHGARYQIGSLLRVRDGIEVIEDFLGRERRRRSGLL